jgi:RNA polymerase sigma-70 factor, ECF subfamily
MTLEQEKELVQQAKSSNESFAKLYDRYYSKIMGYVFRRTLDLNLAKDITSETFLKAYSNIERFQWKGISFSSWIFKIATNEMNMLDRKKKYKPSSLDHVQSSVGYNENQKASLEEERNELERQLKQSEDFIKVQQRLVLLPVKYQEVIALRYFEEKSIKEIAEIVGAKEGTVKSLLSRGIDKLRKLVTT